MNAENFMEYLAQPAKLYQLPYQEIKNLVQEYPYSANLRQLLLLKSRIEQDPKFEQHLHQLAAHTFDREHLFEFIQAKLPRLLDLDTEPEERLELKDLAELSAEEKITLLVAEEAAAEERAFEVGERKSEVGSSEIHEDQEETGVELSIEASTEEPEESMPLADTNISEFPPLTSDLGSGSRKAAVGSGDTHEDQEETVAELSGEALAEEQKENIPLADTNTSDLPPLTSDFQISTALLHTLISGSLLNSTTPLAPKAKEHFASWQQQRGGADSRWAKLRKRSQRGKLAEEEPAKAKQMAKQSVQDQANLASETLAKLLTRQGQYRKAMKIYERLSLLYPEKSRYFAATIEELKQKQ